jgi:hypothetical protein
VPHPLHAVDPTAGRRLTAPFTVTCELRHTHGTLVRKLYGLETAGASLGHSKMSATEVYAERDLTLALKVAAERG